MGKSDSKVGTIAVQLCPFLTPELHGVSNQLHAPSALPQGKSPDTEQHNNVGEFTKGAKTVS